MARCYRFKIGDPRVHDLGIAAGIRLHVFVDESPGVEIRGEELGNVRYPARIFIDYRREHGKGSILSFVKRVEGYLYALQLVIFIKHGFARERGGERSHALLTVDKHRLALRNAAAFDLHVGVLPGDQIAGRVSVVKRVDQVANFGTVPYEGPLDFRNRDVAGFYKPEDALH